MNYALLSRLLGILVAGEAVLMLPSLAVSIANNGNDTEAFLISIMVMLAISLPIAFFVRPKSTDIFAREGFTLVSLGWILLSFFGSLPFYYSGSIPNFIDAWFETVSGFTTTGASILTDVEALPKGLLFWRSFTHWVGGMGVLVLTLALIPRLGSKTVNILRAESPGPSPGKLLPKMHYFAKVLYLIYLVLTVVLVVLLVLCKMPLFDAITHAFGTAGTGGFGIKNLSVGYYNSPAIEFVIGLFMLLFGVNFTVYFALVYKNFKLAYKNSELYAYLIIVVVSIAIITANIAPMYSSVLEAFRYAGFHVSSIITTTGFATADFQNWPMLSRTILLLLMVIGACAGSTGGGIKVVRVLLLGKSLSGEIRKALHPHSITQVKMDGRIVEKEVLHSAFVFFFSYFAVILVSTLIVSADNFGFDTTFSAVISAIGNIGPGIGLVSPSGNYSIFSSFSKFVLSMCMLIGRLEIMPIFTLFTPLLWRKA